MQVREMMTSNPKFIDPDTSLNEAAKKMKELDLGFLPIGDPSMDKLIGTVTDRDIVIRGVAKNKDLNSTKVKEIMSEQVWYCYESDPIEKAADSMKNQKVRRLIVLDKNKKLKGVISLGDIAVHAKDDEIKGKVLEEVSKD